MRNFVLAYAMAIIASVGPSLAKAPGQVICHNGICHRVATLAQTAAAVGRVDVVKASFYDDPTVDRFNPRLETSSGEMLKAHAPDNAASPIWPDGTVLLVRAQQTGQAAVVRVNNAGPYHSDRLIDLSRGLAARLGISAQGVAIVETTVLLVPTPEDASYRRGRTYSAVQGPIGQFDRMVEALATAASPSSRVTTASIGVDRRSMHKRMIPAWSTQVVAAPSTTQAWMAQIRTGTQSAPHWSLDARRQHDPVYSWDRK